MDRARLYRAQTPQAFHRDLIVSTHRRARKERWDVTDDASLMEQMGHEVRIVDNDASGSAKSTVEQFSDLAPRYAIEPERNIALARNRALEFGPADFVAFIDDDEAARPGWLTELCERIRQTGADAVFGPVHACFPAGAPQWAVR